MAASLPSASSNQPNDHMTIHNIILSKQTEGLQEADYDEIEMILKYCDVNARLIDSNNETLMHVAAREKNEKLFKLFYKYGGDFSLKNIFNKTPRDIAMKFKCKYILNFIANIEDEEFFVNSKLTEHKRCKSIKLDNYEELNDFLSNNFDYCKIFPNLFAFKILSEIKNEKYLLNIIHAKFNDDRPLLVWFQSEKSSFYYKSENSKEFNVASEEMSNDIQAIFNHSRLPIDLVKKYCKSKDRLMIRIFSLRKSLDNSKIIEILIKLSDNLEMFLAAVYEPFTREPNDFTENEKLLNYRDGEKKLLKLTIEHDKVEIIDYLIENLIHYFEYSLFEIRKRLVDYIINKTLNNYQDNFCLLIKIDYSISNFLQNRGTLESNNFEELIEKCHDKEGHNILYYIASNCSLIVHERFWERCKIEFQSNKSKLNELLNKKNKFKKNFLQELICTEKFSLEILKFNLHEIEKICNMKDLLLCKGGEYNEIPIQFLLAETKFKNNDKFNYFLNYNLKFISFEELIEKSDDKEGYNILHYIAIDCNLFVHKKLWDRFKIEFQSNKSKLNELLSKRDEFDRNFFHWLVCTEKSSVDILKFNLNEIEKICCMRDLLLSKGGENNELPIQMLIWNTNSENKEKLEYFFNYNLKFISFEELIENSDDKGGNNILHCIAINSNFFIHEKLWKQLNIEFQSNESKLNELLLKENKDSMNFFHWFHWNTNSKNNDKFNYFWNYNLKFVSLEELIEKSDDTDGDNILHYIAINYNLFVHEKLWEQFEIEFQSNKNKLNEILLKRHKDNTNFLHWLVNTEKSSLEIFKLNLIKIENLKGTVMKDLLSCKGEIYNQLPIQMLLVETNSDNKDIFEYFWNFHLKYMSLEELIEKSDDKHGYNILHYIAINCNLFVHEKLWERFKTEFKSNENKINELLNKKSKFEMNFLQDIIYTEEFSLEILEFNLNEIEKICNIKDLLLCRGEINNHLPIQMLLLRTNSDNKDKFDYFWNYNLKYMSLEELVENSDDKEGDNILHYIANNCNLFVHEKLWKQLNIEFQSNESKLNELLLKGNKDSMNFFHWLVFSEESSVEILKLNLNQIEKICDMKDLLLCKGGEINNLPIQMSLSRTNSDILDKFEYFWNYNLKYMNLEELIENSVNKYEENILHFFAVNLNIFVHEKLWERIEIEFRSNKNKLNELLLRADNFNRNFLHKLVDTEKSSVEILELNLNKIKNFFDNANEIFQSKGKEDNTLLQHALTRQKSFDFFKTLWNFLKDSFGRDLFFKHINEINSTNINVFHCALEINEKEINNKKEFIEFIMNSMENDLSKIEIKLFLNPQKSNILTYSAQNVTSIEIHEYLWRVYENTFDTKEILALINEVNSDGFNLLGIVIDSSVQNNLEVVKLIWSKIKNYLKTEDEQKRYVERCKILLDRFSNEDWLKAMMISYDIDFTT